VKNIRFLIYVLLHLIHQSAFATETPWNIWKKNSSQSVSYRPITVNSKELLEIKATARVNSSLSGFIHFIDDVTNTPNWLVNASESKIINRYSTTENSFYIKLTKIWPLKSRILILHSTYWQNKDLSIEIKLTDEDSAFTEDSILLTSINVDDYLKVKTHSAYWKITPVPIKIQIDNKDEYTNSPEIFIEYTFIADGRGDTPKWLADHFSLKSIWKSMRNLKRQLPEEKWQQQSIKGITELSEIP